MIKYWNGYGFGANGDFYGLKGQARKPDHNPEGYAIAKFRLDGKRKTMAIHRIVAQLWLGDCPEGFECDHIDRNRMNFSADNLRYITVKENRARRILVKGVSHHNAKLNPELVLEIKSSHKEGESQRSLSRRFGVDRNIIRWVLSGKIWSRDEAEDEPETLA